MSKIVTIYGGSGFVGRYISRRLAKAGWRIRVAVRHPNEAMHVKSYGAVGQIEPVLCNIRDDASVAQVMHGAEAVVNCVGTFDRGGKNNFDAVQHEGAARIARLAAAEGVERLVHISAIGADEEADTLYAQSNGKGEAAIREHFPTAVILRPSVVFGAEDQFFNRFAGMSRLGPVLPLVGADTRFQPVYVDDVAAAAVEGVEGRAEPGVYELGGPETRSFRDLIREMLHVIRRRRLIVNIPFFAARPMAFMSEIMSLLTGGLIPAQITRDQVQGLRHDNVVSEGARTLADLGIEATSMETVLPDYLWRFRPSGQYEALKESARNLRA